MRLLLLVSLALFSSGLVAQFWIDSNAVWTYKMHGTVGPGYYEYHYNEDTLIDGHLCQKITGVRYHWSWDGSDWVALSPVNLITKFTYTSGDTVFYYNDGEFFVLYNFAAAIGDQWLISAELSSSSAMCNDSSVVEVIDTGTMVIHSNTYRTITLKTLDSSSQVLDGLFVERFGFIPDSSRWRMTPLTQSCNPGYIIQPWYVTFSCFQDDSLALYNPSGNDCQYIPSVNNAGLNEVTEDFFRVYPIPANEFITISSNHAGVFKLFDLQGRVLKELSLQGEKTIDISDLEEGSYFLMFSAGEDLMDIKPFIIAR